MNDEKKLCIVRAEQGKYGVWNMLLSDEQIKVFDFLNRNNYEFEVKVIDKPIEL